jgi:hypothetical protein
MTLAMLVVMDVIDARYDSLTGRFRHAMHDGAPETFAVLLLEC